MPVVPKDFFLNPSPSNIHTNHAQTNKLTQSKPMNMNNECTMHYLSNTRPAISSAEAYLIHVKLNEQKKKGNSHAAQPPDHTRPDPTKQSWGRRKTWGK